MKLVLCHTCSSVFSLSTKNTKWCDCGAVSGIYTDNLNSEVIGIKGKFQVLGFANGSLIDAVRKQTWHGDLDGFYGRTFEAFIIPEKAPTVTRIYTDNKN